MKPSSQFCFRHSSGADVYLLTLTNNRGTTVRISNYGAIIQSFEVQDKTGKLVDIVLGFDNMEEYLQEEYFENYPWFGAAIGPYANRIANASMIIDGKRYALEANHGKHQLHGGITGFDRKVWNIAVHTSQSLTLITTHKDGDGGFPGPIDVSLTYELNDENELSITFRARTDKPTAANFTHHGYFNLDGNGPIDHTEVRIDASAVLKQDADLVATGESLDVNNTHFDFRKPKRIDRDWVAGEGYDQSFVLDKKTDQLAVVAQCRSLKSGIELEVLTTSPVLHFYTGKWIPAVKGKNGLQYEPFTGFCLETQTHPNAINVSHFPNTILRPGQEYFQQTVYRLGLVEH